MVEDDALRALELRGDDAGYLSWLAAHPGGYVVNISKNYGLTDARMPTSAGAWRSDTADARFVIRPTCRLYIRLDSSRPTRPISVHAGVELRSAR